MLISFPISSHKVVSRFVSKPSQPKIRRIQVRKTKSIARISRSGRGGKGGRGSITRTRIGSGPIPPKIKKVQRPQPPLQKAGFTPQVTQFGGGSAINNVFDLIQQTSQRSVERKAKLKAEGRLPAQQPRREPIINIEEIFGFGGF